MDERLIVTCACGQESQVPPTAIGKKGVCGGCGRTIRITQQNTRKDVLTAHLPAQANGLGPNAPAAAKERFGKGFDLFAMGRYAEALAVFDSLSREFPNNPELERARVQCMAALMRRRLPGGEGSSRPRDDIQLDRAGVERIVLEKLQGRSAGEFDAIQLQAARMAGEMLGLFQEDGHAASPPSAVLAPPTGESSLRQELQEERAARSRAETQTRVLSDRVDAQEREITELEEQLAAITARVSLIESKEQRRW